MQVRRATLKDIDEILKIGNYVTEFQVSDEVVTFWPKAVLIDCLKKRINPILVAEENKKIIGFIIVNYNPCFKKAIIENTFVRPEYRGRGVGKELLDTAIKRLKKLGCEYICSLVGEKDSKGITFYIRNGFNKGISCVWLDLIIDKSFKKNESTIAKKLYRMQK